MEASTWHVRLIDYIHRGVITKYISAVHDTWLVSIKMEKERGADLNKNFKKIEKSMFEKNVHRILIRSWERLSLERDRFQKRNKNFNRGLFIVDGNGARPLFCPCYTDVSSSLFLLSLPLTSDKLLVI